MSDEAANLTQDTTDQIEFDLEQLESGNTAQSDPQSEADIAITREASSKGWVPKDKYAGDPSKWVDAATFVDRGKKFNTNLQNKVANLESQLERFKITADNFKKFHEEAMERKDAEVKAAILDLRKQRTEAIREGDDDAAIVLEDRIDILKEEQRTLKETAKQPETVAPDPVLQEWIEDGNTWFKDDVKLQTYAVTLGQELIAKGETLRGRRFLDKVAEIMREEFPAKFGNTNRTRPGMVESGAVGANSGGKTERDLPRADRELMNSFIKEGWTTKEKFLKDYFSR